MAQAAAAEAKGSSVLHLEVGQPATGAPAKSIDAARQALQRSQDGKDALGYTTSAGTEPLREAIARHYEEEYGVTVDSERIVVTTGSSGGFVLSFLACFDPGDRVAMAVPGYPCYANILQTLGVEVIGIPVDDTSNFQLTIEHLSQAEALHGALKGVIVASPSNPTGTMLSPGGLAELQRWTSQRGCWFISDEIYHGITYGTEQQATALQVDGGDGAVVINSFSKYFSMTGWRVAWLVAPTQLLRSIRTLQQNLFISSPAISQHAALAAFQCKEELNGHVARYARNRDIMLEELPLAGFSKLARSDGAIYMYADVGDFTEDSVALCSRILAETGVACTPGVDFDKRRGSRFLRFSFSRSTEEVQEAMRRLRSNPAAWRRG